MLHEWRFTNGMLVWLPLNLQELEQKGEMVDGDPLNNFFKKIFSQVGQFKIVQGNCRCKPLTCMVKE